MKRTLAIAILSLVAVSAFAQGLPESPQPNLPAPVQGYFTVGGDANDNDQYLGRVDEYAPEKQGTRPGGSIGFWGGKGGFRYDFAGRHSGDNRDQGYGLNLDFSRVLRTSVTYGRLYHALDHDPLDALDAAKGSIVVRHTDKAPGYRYSLARTELRVDNKLAVPNLPVTFTFGFRHEGRDGHTQARTLSHCANCHASSYTRGVDQSTNEMNAGMQLKVGHVSVDYTYVNRKFVENAPSPTHLYDDVHHPERAPSDPAGWVFDNRISYGLVQGQLPFNVVPRNRKESHNVRVGIDLPREAMLTMNFGKAYAENEDYDLGVDSTTYAARYSMPLTDKLFFTARFRQMQIQGDSIWIDIAEPAAKGGPQLGKTYEEAYPGFGEVDYMRLSNDSRRPTTVESELLYRIGKRSNLKFSYAYNQVKRDYFEVHETTSNQFKLAYNVRSKSRDWNFRSQYTFTDTDNPFTHVHAAMTPEIQPNPSRGTPPSPLFDMQYFTMYRARTADLTSQPTEQHSVVNSITWSPSARFSVSAHLRANKGKNEDLERFSYFGKSFQADQLNISPGGEMWFAPHQKFSMTTGYYFVRDSGHTPMTMPVYDG